MPAAETILFILIILWNVALTLIVLLSVLAIGGLKTKSDQHQTAMVSVAQIADKNFTTMGKDINNIARFILLAIGSAPPPITPTEPVSGQSGSLKN